MPLVLLAIGALLVPRLTIFLLWLLSGWFNGVFASVIWPILGFIFMPYTLLWYSAVQNLFSGTWGPAQLLGMIIAVLLDLSSSGYGYRHYHDHHHVVEEV